MPNPVGVYGQYSGAPEGGIYVGRANPAEDEAAWRALSRQFVKVDDKGDRVIEVSGSGGKPLNEAERQAAIAMLSQEQLHGELQRRNTIKYRLGGGDLYQRNAQGYEDKGLGLAEGVQQFQPEGYKPVAKLHYGDITRRMAQNQEDENLRRSVAQEEEKRKRGLVAESEKFDQKLKQDRLSTEQKQALDSQDPMSAIKLAAEQHKAQVEAENLRRLKAQADKDELELKARQRLDALQNRQAEAATSGKPLSDQELYALAQARAVSAGQIPPSFDEFMRGREEQLRGREQAATEAAKRKLSDLLAAGDVAGARKLAGEAKIPLPKGIIEPRVFLERPEIKRSIQALIDKANDAAGIGGGGDAGAAKAELDAIIKRAEEMGAEPESVRAAILDDMEKKVINPGWANAVLGALTGPVGAVMAVNRANNSRKVRQQLTLRR